MSQTIKTSMPFPKEVTQRVEAASATRQDSNVSQAAVARQRLSERSQVAQGNQQRKPVMPAGVEPMRASSASNVLENAGKDYMPPVFTNPSADPESISVALPSNFVFYPFKDLYVKPLRALHLAKMNKAHQDSSLQIMVECVSSVLSSTYDTQGLGYELSVQDFHAVLHWLKMHSTIEGVTTTTNLCENPQHIAQVNLGEMPAESLVVNTVITKPDLRIRNLENADMPNMDDFVLSVESPFIMRPPTMKDSVEFLDDEDAMDAEFQFLSKIACVLAIPDVPAAQQPSLRDRIAFVSDLPDSDVQKLMAFDAHFEKFGVKQMIKIDCKVCGASREAELLLEAHSFLPNRG